jgi:hypothetical protein
VPRQQFRACSTKIGQERINQIRSGLRRAAGENEGGLPAHPARVIAVETRPGLHARPFSPWAWRRQPLQHVPRFDLSGITKRRKHEKDQGFGLVLTWAVPAFMHSSSGRKVAERMVIPNGFFRFVFSSFRPFAIHIDGLKT